MSVNPTFKTSNELLDYLKENIPKEEFQYIVGIDVGATNTRIGVMFLCGEKYISTPRLKFQCSCSKLLIEKLNELTSEFVNLLKKNSTSTCLCFCLTYSKVWQWQVQWKKE
jgi:hypothetical protein